jgi:hypothetical protein
LQTENGARKNLWCHRYPQCSADVGSMGRCSGDMRSAKEIAEQRLEARLVLDEPSCSCCEKISPETLYPHTFSDAFSEEPSIVFASSMFSSSIADSPLMKLACVPGGHSLKAKKRKQRKTQERNELPGGR